MNKEFEALNNLLSFAFVMSENMVGLTKGNYDEKYFIKKTYEYLNKYNVDFKSKAELKEALQRLEEIDNAEPSVALEELDFIGKECYIEADSAEGESCVLYAKNYFGYNTIKNYILKAQEQEKENAELKEVMKIIVEKQFYSFCKLTQEERSLLKKWEEKCKGVEE